MKQVKQTILVLVTIPLFTANTCAEAPPTQRQPAEVRPQVQSQLQPVFQQPLLRFKTPKKLDLCGEPVPLERRDVWERLDKQFLLSLSREAQVILWIKRSREYFPVIEKELKQRSLPDDLKYLAVAESDLNKYALSPKGAAGAWQFMKNTGDRFGLDKQEWRDQRYCFAKATNAALDYLALLHEQFGNWMLAMAAYNCGEGRLARELEEQNAESYVDLSLPQETEEYLFRIMAVKIILSNPDAYGFTLSDDEYYLPCAAQAVELTLPGSLHIRALAEAAKTSFRNIKELNPELRGYYLPPGQHVLLIPAEGEEGFTQRLSERIAAAEEGMRTLYVVRRGDTLSAIAAKLGVPIEKLLLWNGMNSAHLVRTGQKLVYYRSYSRK